MIFPTDWYVDVVVERGGGGLDRFGNPLPTSTIPVSRCLIGPKNDSNDDLLGAWGESDATLFHEEFVFLKTDVVTVEGRNAGVWEVLDDSNQWPYGTETAIRRGVVHG